MLLVHEEGGQQRRANSKRGLGERSEGLLERQEILCRRENQDTERTCRNNAKATRDQGSVPFVDEKCLGLIFKCEPNGGGLSI